MRLIELADGDVDRDDTAMWLHLPPVTMGFGFIPSYIYHIIELSQVFDYSIELNHVFITDHEAQFALDVAPVLCPVKVEVNA